MLKTDSQGRQWAGSHTSEDKTITFQGNATLNNADTSFQAYNFNATVNGVGGASFNLSSGGKSSYIPASLDEDAIRAELSLFKKEIQALY